MASLGISEPSKSYGGVHPGSNGSGREVDSDLGRAVALVATMCSLLTFNGSLTRKRPSTDLQQQIAKLFFQLVISR